ncbi:metalloregulator ArsR/SmtB family transcription factor [Patescibacteria group bacterium]
MYLKVFQLHAQLLKAISHPKRLEIIHLLRDQELAVTDIQTMLDLPQANLSQHLQVLRDQKIVKTRRDGKRIFYQLSHKNFIKASDLIREILVERHDKNDEFTKKMKDLVPLVEDPICGMKVSPKTASFAYLYNSKTYYFCASGCLEKYKKNK